MQEQNTTDTEGVEVLETRPFEDSVYGKGEFTSKVYRLQSKVPSWLTKLAPPNALVMQEEAWNAYPKCKSVLKCPGFSKFQLTIETVHKADNGQSENVLGLSKEQLAARQVDFIDIAIPQGKDCWSYLVGSCSMDFSKFKFKSEAVGKCDPVMTAYKLVTIDAPYWGFGRRLEQALLAGERALFLESHRHCIAWIDEWYGVSMQQMDELVQQKDSTLNERLVKPALIMSIDHFDGGSPDTEGVYSNTSDLKSQQHPQAIDARTILFHPNLKGYPASRGLYLVK
ncbi:Phosphatidylinositol transfer protein 1 [Morella rubra]|uniref:Phosphatidylinositol transfer protein 1 n=1 Tax=Morella rubra TaxID=262757 RepID=A0A6A1WN77_9ROSI|nr:Phosphatidylinositol transfer protein 1 [Morella rubra]